MFILKNAILIILGFFAHVDTELGDSSFVSDLISVSNLFGVNLKKSDKAGLPPSSLQVQTFGFDPGFCFLDGFRPVLRF